VKPVIEAYPMSAGGGRVASRTIPQGDEVARLHVLIFQPSRCIQDEFVAATLLVAFARQTVAPFHPKPGDSFEGLFVAF